MQNNVYRRLGELLSASVTQGGSGVHLFNPSVYNYICGIDAADIKPSIEEIPDFEVRELLDQVCMIVSCTMAITHFSCAR